MAKQMRKVRVGSVVSTRMDRTAVVDMVWKQRHRLYRKQMRRVARFYIHDPENQCRLGDTVRIQETRPISKTKHWRLLEILQRRQVAKIRPIELETNIDTAIAEAVEASEAAVVELETGAADAADEDSETGAVESETAAVESASEAPAPARRTRRRAAAAPESVESESAEPPPELETATDSAIIEPETTPETSGETPTAEANDTAEATVDELKTGAADSAEEEPKE